MGARFANAFVLLGGGIQALGGRRFTLTVGCGLVSTIVLACRLIGEASYVTLILASVGAYIAGNTTQAIKAGKSA